MEAAIITFSTIIILLIISQTSHTLSSPTPGGIIGKCITSTDTYVCRNISLEDIKSSLSKSLSTKRQLIIKDSFLNDTIDETFSFDMYDHININFGSIELYNNTISSLQVSTSIRWYTFKNNTILNIINGSYEMDFNEYLRMFRKGFLVNFTENTIHNIEPQAFDIRLIKQILLRGTGLTTIKPGVFKDMYDLILIDLSDNNLTDLQHGTFQNVEEGYPVEISEFMINLRNNKINTICPAAFNTVSIFLLDLSHNNIEILDNGIFSDCEVRILNLSNNHINQIYLNAFNGIRVRQLILSNNDIKVLKANTFEFLTSVTHFDISENPINMIEPDGFYGLSNVRNEKFLTSTGEFNIPRFKIVVIKREMFNGLSSLNRLNLTDHGIETIESEGFYGLESLEELYLCKNKITMLNAEVFIGLERISLIDISYNNIKELDASSLRGLEKTSRTLQLYLQNNNLTYLPVGLFENTPTLRTLNVANNQIGEMDVGIFSGLKMMNKLNVSNNQMYKITKESLYPMLSLNSLDMSNNNLTYFEIEDILFHLRNLKHLNISNNMWGCKILKRIFDVMFEKKIDFLSFATEHYHVDNVHGIFCIPEQDVIAVKLESDSSEENDFNVKSLLQAQHRAMLALVCIVGVGTFVFLFLYIVSNRQKLFSYGDVSNNNRRQRNSLQVELIGTEQ